VIVAGAHATMVAQMAGEFVPVAESVFPMLRKPLATELMKHFAELSKHIRSDLVPVMYIYGRPLDPAKALALKPLEEEAQAAGVKQLEGLIAALRSGKALTIAEFVRSLIDDMTKAIELFGLFQAKKARVWAPSTGLAQSVDAACRELDVHAGDMRTIVRGDTAFRTLLYFLEIASAVMRKMKPRSMLSMRAAS
jgi:hypothetical protein